MFENAIKRFKTGYAFGEKKARSFLGDTSAQAAPMAMLGLVMTAAIMLGIITIVLVLMPSIAGDIITAINVSENNSFYTLVQGADEKATSSFNLLWVAVLVAVVVIIIAGISGLAFIFMRGKA